MKLKGSNLLEAATSHLDDSTDTTNMSVTYLRRDFQDVDITVNHQQPRVSDASTATEQQANNDQEETSRDRNDDQKENSSNCNDSEIEISDDHGELNEDQSLDDQAA